jgi:hypothetical protein
VAFLDGDDADGPYVARRLLREPGDEAHAIYEVVGPDESCIVGDCGDYYEGSCREYRLDGFGCRHGDAPIGAGVIAGPATYRPAGQGVAP